MTVINIMGQASPNIRLAYAIFKKSKMRLPKKTYLFIKAVLDYQKQTKTSLVKFYLYNVIQLPIFVTMIMSVRKVSFENTAMMG